MKKKPLLLALAVFAATSCKAGDLPVTAARIAPLTVQITGPDILTARGKGFMQGRPYAGCMYEIDWGDGTSSPQVGFEKPYCFSDLKHTYATPGTYRIEAKIYDQGPADGPDNEREGSTSLDVN